MALSPMMQHYIKTKEKYNDAILMYRLGDFYEMFFEDAEICSRVLELTLTGKDCGLDKRAPMCGVPFHAVEPYVARLINNGYKVAICEQLTLPKKGVKIVERDVVRIITPGTVMDSSMLDETTTNYLCCIYLNKNNAGASYLDITTGQFYMTELEGADIINQINDLLVRIKPTEILCNNELYIRQKELQAVVTNYVAQLSLYDETNFDYDLCYSNLTKQFNSSNLTQFNCDTRHNGIMSSGALLSYVTYTQKRDLTHINSISYVVNSNYMQLDATTRRNLELTETLRERKKKGSIVWLLNKTQTKMGERMLTEFVENPLYDDKQINYRLDGVEDLIKNMIARETIKELLYQVYDIERLTGKISYGNLMPKDCLSLAKSLKLMPDIKNVLSKFSSIALTNINNDILVFDDIVSLIDSSIVDNPPLQLKDGGFIKKGYSNELDELLNISTSGKTWLATLEAHEKERTGIKNLKIGFNKVFGYYIEIPASQKDKIPFDYIRKQTTVNNERYITEELKNMENKILNATEQIVQLELKLFDDIRTTLLSKVKQLQTTSHAIAFLDTLLSLSIVATERNYVKPIVNKSNKNIEIVDGRHPIVELLVKDEEFVPNDTMLNTTDNRTMIITGPNMAGKSTYMRQVAIITLMAHIGSFVPAKSAKIALTDKIFTRIGASDDLSFGQSTFMVEMTEVSNILKHATNNSLLLLDEVGRGTSTFDGLSIAWSVIEYITHHLFCKTLFATHYHELIELEGSLDGVKNYQVCVKEYDGSVIFLRKITRGAMGKSFGIEVASLAGLPKEVLVRAKQILLVLEQNDINRGITKQTDNSKVERQTNAEVISILKDLNVNTLTPLSAFDTLVNLKNKLK